MSDNAPNLPPDTPPEEPRARGTEQLSLNPDSPENTANLRADYIKARNEIITPFKAQAVAYFICDFILTGVGAAISSPIMTGAGLASLAGSLNNFLFTGGNLPRLFQAAAIIFGRNVYASIFNSGKETDFQFPSYLSDAAFKKALAKARSDLNKNGTEESEDKLSPQLMRSLFFYKIAGGLFVLAGVTGEGFKELFDFMNGEGSRSLTEKAITGAVNLASIGYGVFFTLGNYFLRADVITKEERRRLEVDPDPVFTLSPLAAAKGALRQKGGLRYQWHYFRHNSNLEHIGSNTLLLASGSLMVTGIALITGGIKFARPEMVKAGVMMCVAAGISSIGDFCARLGENRSLVDIHKKSKSRLRYSLRRFKNLRVRRAVRLTRQMMRLRKIKLPRTPEEPTP